MVAALIANRLTAPRPLYDVAGWAGVFASHDWLGAPAALLNDDRLGRALDAISAHLDEIAGALALAAGGQLRCGGGPPTLGFHLGGVLRRVATRMSVPPGRLRAFFGSAWSSPPAQGGPRHHRRWDCPVRARAADGSCHEGAETHTLLERLRSFAAPRRLLLVADSALVSKDNLAAADAARMRFVSRLPLASIMNRPPWVCLPRRGGRCPIYRRVRRLPKKAAPDLPGAGRQHRDHRKR